MAKKSQLKALGWSLGKLLLRANTPMLFLKGKTQTQTLKRTYMKKGIHRIVLGQTPIFKGVLRVRVAANTMVVRLSGMLFSLLSMGPWMSVLREC